MQSLKHIIDVNPEILGGTPVFKGTRIAISTLFDYLETSSLEDFLEGYPSVKKDHAMAVIETAEKLLTSTSSLYEGIAL